MKCYKDNGEVLTHASLSFPTPCKMLEQLSLAVSGISTTSRYYYFYRFRKEEMMVLIQNKLPTNLVNLYIYRIVDLSKPICINTMLTNWSQQFVILSTDFVLCHNPISDTVSHLEIMSLFLLHLWQFFYPSLFYYMILSLGLLANNFRISLLLWYILLHD